MMTVKGNHEVVLARDWNENLEVVTRKLLTYCKNNDWAGHDPYDALNSELFTALPILDTRLTRIALTQILKRSPIDVRGLARVRKTQNPKAIALFLAALLKLQGGRFGDYQEAIQYLIERLVELRSSGVDYWCWGYSFPWQGRKILVPAGAPNLVCTTFVANALLDAHDACGDQHCLTMALSAARYILKELYWSEGKLAGFSYPMPSLRGECHNANLLASALLCRVSKYAAKGEAEGFTGPALRVTRQTVARQRPDGSWYYGESPSQRWIDNFHTGYNLGALDVIGRCLGTDEFCGRVERGFAFYRSHFFREDSAPKYFHDRVYPIDIHCVAQSIITLVTLQNFDSKNIELARAVFQWAVKNMWDEPGFFYYRVHRLCTIRTSYMRWSQAWMLLAQTTLFCDSEPAAEVHLTKDSQSLVKVC